MGVFSLFSLVFFSVGTFFDVFLAVFWFRKVDIFTHIRGKA